jgi:hypothetical protein
VAPCNWESDGLSLFLDLWLDFDPDCRLFFFLFHVELQWHAHLAGAILHVARLVGAQPEEVWEELERAPEALAWALGVAVQVCILAVVAAARVVLARPRLAIGLGLDVFVEGVVVGEIPQDALLPFVCSCPVRYCPGPA